MKKKFGWIDVILWGQMLVAILLAVLLSSCDTSVSRKYTSIIGEWTFSSERTGGSFSIIEEQGSMYTINCVYTTPKGTYAIKDKTPILNSTYLKFEAADLIFVITGLEISSDFESMTALEAGNIVIKPPESVLETITEPINIKRK